MDGYVGNIFKRAISITVCTIVVPLAKVHRQRFLTKELELTHCIPGPHHFKIACGFSGIAERQNDIFLRASWDLAVFVAHHASTSTCDLQFAAHSQPAILSALLLLYQNR
jgi:hypothetical protein